MNIPSWLHRRLIRVSRGEGGPIKNMPTSDLKKKKSYYARSPADKSLTMVARSNMANQKLFDLVKSINNQLIYSTLENIYRLKLLARGLVIEYLTHVCILYVSLKLRKSATIYCLMFYLFTILFMVKRQLGLSIPPYRTNPLNLLHCTVY